MRCLYCGKELALLKRLTGSGQFCSEAHKVSYHDEYNRIALSRLLQAQTKPAPPKPLPSKEARLPEKEPAKVEVAQEKPAAVEAVAETLVAPQAVAETPATPQAVAETPATQAAVLVADAVEQEVA